MKTGIIRRIDELGRIVVPKEIRKSLRIKDGENLEIFVEKEEIILKKYSIIKKISDLAINITDAVYLSSKKNMLITDLDEILAISGIFKKEYLNNKISKDLLNLILKREETIKKEDFRLTESTIENLKFALCPIIVGGDILGASIVYSLEDVDEFDLKIAKIISKILEQYLEN